MSPIIDHLRRCRDAGFDRPHVPGLEDYVLDPLELAIVLELDERLKRVEALIGTEADWPPAPSIADVKSMIDAAAPRMRP